MSDTELSHCEQFLFGLMLTNELSSASSEKSSHSGPRGGMCKLFCKKKKRKKIVKIIQIFNNDQRWSGNRSDTHYNKGNNVYPCGKFCSTADTEIIKQDNSGTLQKTNSFHQLYTVLFSSYECGMCKVISVHVRPTLYSNFYIDFSSSILKKKIIIYCHCTMGIQQN